MLHLIAAPLLALPLQSGAPTLDYSDLTMGTFTDTPAVEHCGFVPGHTGRFDLSGPVGGTFWLFVAPPAPTPLPLGTGELLLDVGGAALLGAGPLFGGSADQVWVVLPPTLPLGLELATQAFMLAPSSGVPQPTNGLTHVTTDLSGTVLLADDASIHPQAEAGGLTMITDEPTWLAFWDAHTPYTPKPPAPSVDFARDVVVVSFWGFVGTTGYSLEIDDIVTLGPGLVEVRQTLHTPGLGCGGGFQAGTPFVLLAVDRALSGATLFATTTQAPGPPCP